MKYTIYFIFSIFVMGCSSLPYTENDLTCTFYKTKKGFVDESPKGCTDTLNKYYKKNPMHFHLDKEYNLIEPRSCPSFFDLDVGMTLEVIKERDDSWKPEYIKKFIFSRTCW